MKKRGLKWLAILLIPIAIITACFIYLATYSPADDDSIAAFAESGEEYLDERGNMVFEPSEKTDIGFIFYPGGKVEASAYTPLARLLAQNGILCIITPMPFNLAIFDTGAAESVISSNKGINRWYIGGHSLGGSMAASYAANNEGKIEGLVLLAAYSTEEISIPTLSLIATEDGVLNHEKYEENKKNCIGDFIEHTIQGGCHAYFGMYGTQKGDGNPEISAEEQIAISAELITDFIASTNKTNDRS